MGLRRSVESLVISVQFVVALSTPERALGQQQGGAACVADLARVQKGFCMGSQHRNSPLSYSWGLTAGSFDLVFDSCFSGARGPEQDLLIAVDRSHAMQGCIESKLCSPVEETVQGMIDQFRQALPSDKGKAVPRLGIVFFSSDSQCVELDAKDPFVPTQERFPCRYVPLGDVRDPNHQRRIEMAMAVAGDQYSEDGGLLSSDLGIVAQHLAKNTFGSSKDRPTGVVLITHGRPFLAKPGAQQAYSYLHAQNYREGLALASQQWSPGAVQRAKLVVAVVKQSRPYLRGAGLVSAYETMCASEPTQEDCAGNVKVSEPATWPVNLIDAKAQMTSLVEANGGSRDQVIEIVDTRSVTQILDQARYAYGASVPVELARLEAGSQRVDAKIEKGQRIIFSGISGPADANQSTNLQSRLVLKVEGREESLGLNMALTRREMPASGAFEDREMLCRGDAALIQDAPASLGVMQGGAASCGVIPGVGEDPGLAALLVSVLLLVAPLAVIYFATPRRRQRNAHFLVLLMGVVLLAVLFAHPLFALDLTGPSTLAKGPGLTEDSSVLPVGEYHILGSMSYTRRPLEIVDSHGKAQSAILDHVGLLRMRGEAGVYQGTEVGLEATVIPSARIDHEWNGTSTRGRSSGLGDLRLDMRYRLGLMGPLTWALLPRLDLPTGKKQVHFGDGATRVGLGLAGTGSMTSTIRGSVMLGLAHRLGTVEMADSRASNVIRVRTHATLGLGVEMSIVPNWAGDLSLLSQWSVGPGAFAAAVESPKEWQLGASHEWTRHWAARLGLGTGLGRGYGAPDVRIDLSIRHSL